MNYKYQISFYHSASRMKLRRDNMDWAKLCSLFVATTFIAAYIVCLDNRVECEELKHQQQQQLHSEYDDLHRLKYALIDFAKKKFQIDYAKNLDFNVKVHNEMFNMNEADDQHDKLLSTLQIQCIVFNHYYTQIRDQKHMLERVTESQLDDFSFLLDDDYYGASILLVEKLISFVHLDEHFRKNKFLENVELFGSKWHFVKRWCKEFVSKIADLIRPSDIELIRSMFREDEVEE